MKTLQPLFYLILLLLGNACTNKNVFMSRSSGDISELANLDSMYYHRIKPDDKISLSIWNHDDMSVGSVFSIYNSNEAYGKWILVEANGEIVLPKIGTVNIGGMTCPEAALMLKNKYEKYLVNPLIVVKVLNREVTVLGEVRTPGVYTIDKERFTLTEAIGKAQGFEKYANFKKVQLIRDGVSYSINLLKLDDRELHAIIVESGDIINVPSRRGKRLDQKAPTLIPFASALTALALVISLTQ